MKRIRKLAVALIFTSSFVTLGFQNCIGVGGGGGGTVTPSTKGVEAGNPYSPLNFAALPRIILNSDYPNLPSGHKVITVGPQKEFQDCQGAVDSANPGDEVVIDSGFLCSPLVLPNKGENNSYVVIRSSGFFNLPPQGTRVQRTDASNMAIVEVSDSRAAIKTDLLANHYYLGGLEIRLASRFSGIHGPMVLLGPALNTDPNQFAHDITIARSWVHANPNQEQGTGIALNGSALSVVDSIIEEMHLHNGYAEGIGGWNLGTGPFRVVNNEISSAGPNFIAASSGVYQNWIPSDIEFRQNYLHKQTAWAQAVTSSAGGTGFWMMSSLLRVENAQRLLFAGNIFENNFTQSQGPGVAIQLSPTSSDNGALPAGSLPWVRVQDITLADNIIRNCASVVSIMYQDPQFPSVVAQRIDFENNLAYDLISGAPGMIYLQMQSQNKTAFNHNTFLDLANGGPQFIGTSNGLFADFVITNNIVYDPGKGIDGLTSNFPGLTLNSNVLAGQMASNYGAYANGNYFPLHLSDIGFLVDPTNGVVDYNGLELSPSSPYHSLGNDGADIGVNIPELNLQL